MESFFHLKERNTTVAIEIMAGITTFVAMSYILMVNPGMFTNLNIEGAPAQLTFGSIYIATALSAVVGTLLIGLLANLPLAQASGMGLNAFFVFSVCFGLGFTYANALVFVMIDGLLFIVLTATGLRQVIFDAIPTTVTKAISVGIGLFIAFLGLQDSGIVVPNESTGVTLTSFNLLSGATWSSIMPIIITVGTVIAMARLSKNGVKGAILISMLGGTVAYYILNIFTPGFYDNFTLGVSLNPLDAFAEWGEYSFMAVFRSGFDFSGYLSSHSGVELVITFITTSLAFCLVDMFDTLGTLFGACHSGGLLVQNSKTGEEEIPKGKSAMLADAIATFVGSIFGTSTVTTYVESSAGVATGGRTGLSSIVTAGLFLIASFLTPIAALVPSCAYAAALIYVGILMIGSVKEIHWDNPIEALPAFATMTIMPFTYSISYGIAFGLIFYIGASLGQYASYNWNKKGQRWVASPPAKKVHINASTWVITVLFVAMLLTSH